MRRVLRIFLYRCLGNPETVEELVAVLRDAHMEPVADRHELVIYTGWGLRRERRARPDAGGRRVRITEDQARLGGCCICPDPCGGVDIDEEAASRGVQPCVIECAWCMNGCPIAPGERCTCQDQPACA